ncbi:hypothetical protein NDU88_001149 [Pleurodeles waltl]|uniref:Uncharacterized protein n=1 Tax=Pleurodeles waltl TaxID=8319 RepID=A0AAV7V7D7_PLEWA|nr:hypothetical protein NDU88_001149 [Pleurodeles waltl]
MRGREEGSSRDPAGPALMPRGRAVPVLPVWGGWTPLRRSGRWAEPTGVNAQVGLALPRASDAAADNRLLCARFTGRIRIHDTR